MGKDKDADKETKSGEKNDTKEKSKSDNVDEEKIRVRRTEMINKEKKVKNLNPVDFEASEEKAKVKLDSYLTRDTSGDKNWANYGTNNDFLSEDDESDDARGLTKDDDENIKDDAKVEDDDASTDGGKKEDRAMSKSDIDRAMKNQNEISLVSEPEMQEESSEEPEEKDTAQEKTEAAKRNRNLASAEDIFDSNKRVKLNLVNPRELGQE